jgi:uncharacterized protein YbaP (TraB family)
MQVRWARRLCDFSRFALIWIALLPLVPRASEGSAPELASPAPRRVYLWQVRAAGESSASLYLLGSTHAARRPQQALDPAIEAAFTASDSLAVEVDTRHMAPGQIARVAHALGRSADGRPLQAWVPPALYEAARSALGTQGLPRDALDGYEPWFASLQLAGQALTRLGYNPSYGVDEYFLRRADGKRVVELEGASAQLQILDRLSPEQQRAMFERTVAGLGSLGRRIAALSAAWRAGDAAQLGALTFAPSISPAGAQDFDELFYFARNRAMAEKLERSLRAGGTWFAVIGAAHMSGEQGLPALFEARGYRVQQLAAQGAELPEPPEEPPVGFAVLR